MFELCACGQHRFEISFTEEEVECPVCGLKYAVFVDADDDGDLVYELIPA